ncbi:MAG: hypothetical protein AB2L12_05465 [Smithellaceae bacterium]
MKKLTLILFSIVMGLLFGRYYSLVPRKLLTEYVTAAFLSFKFGKLESNNAVNLIPLEESVK